MTDHEAWLELTGEDPIEPEIPICDPHHHLWDFPGDRYLLEELFRDIGGGHNIVSTVFVECLSIEYADDPSKFDPVEETRFVHGLAVRNDDGKYGPTKVAAGIVSSTNLTLGRAVAPLLEAHMAASDRFRGIRQVATWSEHEAIFSPGIRDVLRQPGFRQGLACLKEYGLTFETFAYHNQLPDLAGLADAFPDMDIILNHVGGPLLIGPYAARREEVMQEWRDNIKELAERPNVLIKLGGLGMPYFGYGWDERPAPPSSGELAEAMKTFYLPCIESFGANRCMFESNFPVDRRAYSYTVLWNAFKRFSADFSPDERRALFHDTAAKAYRL